MGLETATYISELNNSFPLGGDPINKGDDHLRLLKSVLQSQFPNFAAAAMSASEAELNILDGVTASTAELNTLVGQTTPAVQTGVNSALLDDILLQFGTAGAESEISSNGTNTIWNLKANKDLIINDDGTSRFLFDSSLGDFHADGDLFAFSTSVGSDPKLKQNIKPIQGALDKVYELHGIEFEWKKNGEASAGLLSTDVKAVLPVAVKDVISLGETENEDKGETYESVNYNAVIGLLVEAIKELTDKVEKLEAV